MQLFILLISCYDLEESSSFLRRKSKKKHRSILKKPKSKIKICGWYTEKKKTSEKEITKDLSFFHQEGVDCVNYMTDIPKYERAVKIAKSVGIEIYAWIPAMLGLGFNKKWIYKNHPEAYARTRSGIDSYKEAIFGVDHYKFLCPSRPVVRDFLKSMYNNVSKIKGLNGINLDYIRFIEVNHAFNPHGDTCYCDYCRSNFYNKTGINISNVEQPNHVKEWNLYRINTITSLVNEIAKIVHSNGIRITADVYPGPGESHMKSKQQWDDWDLDMVFQMVYTGVFRKPVEWIGEQTKEGKDRLSEKKRKTVLITGLQAEIMNDKDFRTGVRLALENGADGICIFQLTNINIEKFAIVREEVKRFLNKNKK